jgi:hypothetical protein
MKPHKNLKEFSMPNSLIQNLTADGTDSTMLSLSGIDLITLVGCLALVDPKRPGDRVEVKFASLLSLLQFSKSCSHRVFSHALIPPRKRAEYSTGRFSPKLVAAIKSSIEQLFQAKCVSFRRVVKAIEEKHTHLFESYGFVYEDEDNVLDLDDLPFGLEKINTCVSCPRPVYKLRYLLSGKLKPSTKFFFHLHNSLVEELKGGRCTYKFTKLSVKIFSLLGRLGRDRTTIRTLLLILRQTSKDGFFVRSNLKSTLRALGFDSSHFSESCTSLSALLSKLIDEGIVVSFNVDTENNRLEITQNKNWYQEASL